MRKAEVFRNGKLVGLLIQYSRKQYEFQYDDDWFTNDKMPAISFTLPKVSRTYKADHLFPFFFNMLAEGMNRKLQARQLKIDEKDYFGLLLATATSDTIGAVTIKPVEVNKK